MTALVCAGQIEPTTGLDRLAHQRIVGRNVLAEIAQDHVPDTVLLQLTGVLQTSDGVSVTQATHQIGLTVGVLAGDVLPRDANQYKRQKERATHHVMKAATEVTPQPTP